GSFESDSSAVRANDWLLFRWLLVSLLLLLDELLLGHPEHLVPVAVHVGGAELQTGTAVVGNQNTVRSLRAPANHAANHLEIGLQAPHRAGENQVVDAWTVNAFTKNETIGKNLDLPGVPHIHDLVAVLSGWIPTLFAVVPHVHAVDMRC